MTPTELIDELRSRINPAYATQIGTESYERRICAEALESLLEENAKLRVFANAIMEAWPGLGIDGGDLQDIATKHGLLKPEIRHEPCRKLCRCSLDASPQGWLDGVRCYRVTPLLTGATGQTES